MGAWDIDLTTGLLRGTARFFRIMGLAPTTEPVPIETTRCLRHPDDRDRVLHDFNARARPTAPTTSKPNIASSVPTANYAGSSVAAA